MHYRLSRHPHLARHFTVELRCSTEGQTTLVLQLPNWRPGRYELANYARNVVQFEATTPQGRVLRYQKISRLEWELQTEGQQEVVVTYSYYANQPDAGACWVDDDLFYVNPVNCLMYTTAARYQPCRLELLLQPGEHAACGLPHENGLLLARDFDELVDSPILASAHLKHHAFQCEGVSYYLWFYGVNDVPWQQLENDFRAFTLPQHKMMGELPVTAFHYLNLILPFRFYHGVEHRNSTVIALGPADEVFGSQYKELLGVSSHELFHTWNVKFIQPAPFKPYDYSRENYSPLGYVYEGFTTYYGDLFLYRGGVFNWESYSHEVNVYLKRHFDNYGRNNHSLHESSIDTWVDGYGGPAAPNRRVSIYAEGMLNALCLDLEIRKSSANQHSLDDLMRLLYADAKDGRSYNESDLLRHLHQLTGIDFNPFFELHYRNPISLEDVLPKKLQWIGCTLETKSADDPLEAFCGVRGIDQNGKRTVTAIAPSSPAALAGLMVEDILDLPEMPVNHEWAPGQMLTLVWHDRMLCTRTNVVTTSSGWFRRYELVRLPQVDALQEEAFSSWSAGKP